MGRKPIVGYKFSDCFKAFVGNKGIEKKTHRITTFIGGFWAKERDKQEKHLGFL